MVELAGEANRVEGRRVRQGGPHGAVEAEDALVADVEMARRAPEVRNRQVARSPVKTQHLQQNVEDVPQGGNKIVKSGSDKPLPSSLPKSSTLIMGARLQKQKKWFVQKNTQPQNS